MPCHQLVGMHGSCVRVNSRKSGITFGRTDRASLHFGSSASADLQSGSQLHLITNTKVGATLGHTHFTTRLSEITFYSRIF